MPKWVVPDRDISHIPEKSRTSHLRSARYYRKIYEATPKWYDQSHHEKILRIYKEAERQRKLGLDVHVDHIIPVCSDEVCGLNVPWNYKIIPSKVNIKKSNIDWPDKHVKQYELEGFTEEPHQMKLF